MNLAGLVVTKRDGNENRMKKMEVSTSTDGATWFPLAATENMPKEWVITAPEGTKAKWIKVEAKNAQPEFMHLRHILVYENKFSINAMLHHINPVSGLLAAALFLSAPVQAALPAYSAVKDEAKTVNKYMIVVWAGTDWSPKSREITRAVEHLAKNSPEPVLWCIQDEREEMTEEEQKLPKPRGNLEHPRHSGGLPHRKHGIPVGRRLQGNIASRHEAGNGSRKTAKQGQCPVGKSRRFIRNGRGPSLRRRASATSSLCGLCQKGYSGKIKKADPEDIKGVHFKYTFRHLPYIEKCREW